MTQVNTADGAIETDLPAEAVADLAIPEEAPQEQPETAPETTAEPEKAEEPAKEPEAAVEPIAERPKKAGPIADLLEKKHQAEEEARAEKAKNAELEARLAELSKQKPSVQTDDKIKALAEKHGLDEEVLADIIATAREGVNPALPQELQDLIAKSKADELQRAEEAAFNKRVDSLSNTLKDDLLKDPSVRGKLQKLAYSTEKAPDGEPYFQKELAELYFAFIKPEVEPGRVSVEDKSGGKGNQSVLDYEEIHNDETRLDEFAKTATSEQWAAYTKWRDDKQGDVPIRRKTTN